MRWRIIASALLILTIIEKARCACSGSGDSDYNDVCVDNSWQHTQCCFEAKSYDGQAGGGDGRVCINGNTYAVWANKFYACNLNANGFVSRNARWNDMFKADREAEFTRKGFNSSGLRDVRCLHMN